MRAAGRALALLLLPVAAHAAPIQTAMEALAQDGAEYARAHHVPLPDAIRRLQAQEASVAETDRLRAEFADRLAGIAIEHEPAYRIVVRLTGDEAVADRTIQAAGLGIPIVFVTGAAATRAQVLEAIERHQADLRAALRRPPGLGVDDRNGGMTVMVASIDLDDGLAGRLAAIAGVPVTIRSWSDATADMSVQGGGRVSGIDPADRRRKACTSGFVVTDGSTTAIATAAHCPDELVYQEIGGERVPLSYVGAWGARYQDVQIHRIDGAPLQPLFHPDAAGTLSRPLATWRNRASTRAGDFVCHRGERTGYSCADIAYVDYAPPGDLCAGPCPATWVAVEGPSCGGGDSGGPVFLGLVAFGLMKGGSYGADRTCRLYYYMSTDYLPPGWTLLH